MGSSDTDKRPWLATVLAVLVTGLGHVYLRRWVRAIGWICLAILVTLLFVPETAIQSPNQLSFWDTAPLLVIVSLSGLDAYLLARVHNTERQVDAVERCPECYRELDHETAFCTWCAAELSTDSVGDDGR